tara:strand:- start:6408 stop:7340 length:933 start_codon:yes stop_codon:yes gene_type:complete
MLSKLISINLIIIFFCVNNLYSNNIFIKVKLNNEIITNIDILNEKNYLLFLNNNLKNLKSKDVEKIAKSSLIREIIKKNEIKKYLDISKDYSFLKEIEQNLLISKKISSTDEFKKLLAVQNLKYEDIKNKLKIEALWNHLVYKRYNNNVKIDEVSLKKKIQENIKRLEKKFEYNLSEILFEVNKVEDIQNKYKEILNSIKINGFKNSANIYGISNTSKIGGEIGWIKGTQLSDKLINKINKMKVDDIIGPIQIQNGYLILKLNDKRELKKIINIDKELEQLINFEKNKQLEQFSLIYFKRLKQNTTINEY